MIAVIVVGIVCTLVAFSNVEVSRLDSYLGLLAVVTLVVGSRMSLQIPTFKAHISVSDTFIFLTLLIYGGEFAVILAALEATVSSWRFCHRKITVLFNAALMAISTTAIVLVLKGFGLYTESQLHGREDGTESFIIVLSLIALTHFLTNTSLATLHDVIRDRLNLWETWKSKYAWVFFSSFVGAASAGALIQLADKVGLGIILATFPIIFFLFLTYRMYLNKVEISIEQKEQAEEYANILELKSNALRESEERFRSAFDYAPIGIGLVAPLGNWLKTNRALIDILGYSEDEFLARDYQSMICPDDLALTLLKIHELTGGKIASCQMEQRYIHKTGRTVWTSWSASAASDGKSVQPNLIFQIQDITEKKATEEKLQYDATHDPLTGLPNRLFFMDRLDEALEKKVEINDYKVSVLFIDLDRFKYVNDSLGHLVGDDLLKEISLRLSECMRPTDLVARLGGDEFTILVAGKFDPIEVTRIAERIQNKFRIPFNLRGHEVYSSASIGILHASDKHGSSEDIMRDADTAMYRAKHLGKACHVVFDSEMHIAAKETLKLETDLRRAVENKEIKVFYQPIYDLGNGEISSVEALARWEHPERGYVPADKFIPVAEEIGLIDELCNQVLRKACEEIGTLRNIKEPDRKYAVSINLSSTQFGNDSIVENIQRILIETGFSPRELKIEITESLFFEHQQRATLLLNQLRESGVEINIDDFGTGYSNLGYLQKLPITALKIDRSFVSMIDDEGKNDQIVRSIITLARNIGLKVVAEGIETNTQLQMLKLMECEGGQGYLLAKPMQFEELGAFLVREVIPATRHDLFENIPTLAQIQ